MGVLEKIAANVRDRIVGGNGEEGSDDDGGVAMEPWPMERKKSGTNASGKMGVRNGGRGVRGKSAANGGLRGGVVE